MCPKKCKAAFISLMVIMGFLIGPWFIVVFVRFGGEAFYNFCVMLYPDEHIDVVCVKYMIPSFILLCVGVFGSMAYFFNAD